jgi:hypothetical protein
MWSLSFLTKMPLCPISARVGTGTPNTMNHSFSIQGIIKYALQWVASFGASIHGCMDPEAHATFTALRSMVFLRRCATRLFHACFATSSCALIMGTSCSLQRQTLSANVLLNAKSQNHKSIELRKRTDNLLAATCRSPHHFLKAAANSSQYARPQSSAKAS